MSNGKECGVERLDIGCGKPAEKYPGCFGIDVNPVVRPDLLWDCDRGLPFADETLTFINSDNSLEHFKHPYRVLEECHRCLLRGGRMRLVVPNAQYFPTLLLSFVCDVDRYFFWYMRLPHKRERGVHYTLFTRHLIERIAGEIGFMVIRSRGFLYSKEITLELERP
ncbi:MAG: methyltransferase domain-containing protein [Candidatus Binatia bacterium]